MPFILTSIDEKMKLFEFRSRAFLPSLLIKTLFLGQLEQTRLDLLTVSPIKENYGLVSPTTPEITYPVWIPIFTLNFSPFLREIVLM